LRGYSENHEKSEETGGVKGGELWNLLTKGESARDKREMLITDAGGAHRTSNYLSSEGKKRG